METEMAINMVRCVNGTMKILGQLYQESDQDEKAILAFKEAHEKDPYDLDSLLALGISFTNELSGPDAFSYMHQWLKYNPDY